MSLVPHPQVASVFSLACSMGPLARAAAPHRELVMPELYLHYRCQLGANILQTKRYTLYFHKGT